MRARRRAAAVMLVGRWDVGADLASRASLAFPHGSAIRGPQHSTETFLQTDREKREKKEGRESSIFLLFLSK